jgi:hypothetical protein
VSHGDGWGGGSFSWTPGLWFFLHLVVYWRVVLPKIRDVLKYEKRGQKPIYNE